MTIFFELHVSQTIPPKFTKVTSLLPIPNIIRLRATHNLTKQHIPRKKHRIPRSPPPPHMTFQPQNGPEQIPRKNHLHQPPRVIHKNHTPTIPPQQRRRGRQRRHTTRRILLPLVPARSVHDDHITFQKSHGELPHEAIGQCPLATDPTGPVFDAGIVRDVPHVTIAAGGGGHVLFRQLTSRTSRPMGVVFHERNATGAFHRDDRGAQQWSVGTGAED
mmetsp:Transcript_33657/g.41238  ORF Transcript_33657/g.41238 Transcript_33657/m.41238 type:complete len:218 (-) Transcript_33657:623-1276(-)